MKTTEPPDPTAPLRAGAQAYRDGDVRTALRIFEEAVGVCTGRIRLAAMVNAASMADSLGDHERSARWLRTALAEMPDDAGAMRPTALVNLSQALQHLGDLGGAAAALAQARALLTDDPEHGTLLVSCLLSETAVAIHRQRWPEAIDSATESLTAARRFAPELAGHPLSNLAAANFEIGRHDSALDFAEQALAAFTAAGDGHGTAETRQNLALMYIRCDRLDDAEPLLLSSQDFFERGGLGPRAGIGLKATGFLAERRGDPERAYLLYAESVARFTGSGAVLEAADARIRWATIAVTLGRTAEADRLFAESFRVFDRLGLGLHCAQLDYWQAELLIAMLDETRPDPAVVRRALELVVPAAVTVDAVRYGFGNGNQRQHWDRHVAEPAIRLAFRCAALARDAGLIADLIETRCAGVVPDTGAATGAVPPGLPLDLPEPPDTETDSGAYALGAALAAVAADTGLPVAPPPQLRVAPDGHIALAGYVAVAQQRYRRSVRGDRVVPV